MAIDWNEIGYAPGVGSISLRTFAVKRVQLNDYVLSFFREDGHSPGILDLFRGADPVAQIEAQLGAAAQHSIA